MVIKERRVSNKLLQLIDRREIIILIGSRQTGKTTLLKWLEQTLSAKGELTAYFNLEIPHHLSILSQSYQDILKHLKFTLPLINEKKLYLFIDEFQYLPQANSLLKVFYDENENIKMIVSGSSSCEIQKKVKESLAGRKRDIPIYPLDFYEYLRFKDKNLPMIELGERLPDSIIAEINNEFYDFLLFGGMPAIVLENNIEEKKEMLVGIYSAYIQKDIKGLIGQDKILHFNNLMQLLALRAGNILVTDEIAQKVMASRYQIQKDLFILENTYVNFLLSSFFANKEKEVIRNHKTYFYDNGIRQAVINNFTPLKFRQDIGSLVENCVFLELKKNMRIDQKLYFYRKRNQTEVDFVLSVDNEVIPIEVKASSCSKIPRSLISFIKEYKPQKAFVLNADIMDVQENEGCKIYFLPLFLASEVCIPK